MAEPRRSHERIETERLVLRKPEEADAEAIFKRYASHAETTKYLGWPTHRSRADTLAFLGFASAEWHRAPAGPYLIESKSAELEGDGEPVPGPEPARGPRPGPGIGPPADGIASRVIGSTGLAFETATRAQVGYLVADPFRGYGFATEALRAMIELAPTLGVRRLYALCHPDHAASKRVLEKCGLEYEGRLRRHQEFPNLDPPRIGDVDGYSIVW